MESKHIEEEFNADDKYPYPNIGKFILRTIEIYKKGYRIEAFVGLFDALEEQLFTLWTIFLIKSLDQEFKPVRKFWPYLDSIELLQEAKIIDQSIFSELKSFKRGRDLVAHYYTNQFLKKKIDSKKLDDHFNKGIIAYKHLIEVRKNLVKLINTVPHAKKIKLQVSHSPAGFTNVRIVTDNKESSTFTTTSTSFVDVVVLELLDDKKRKYVKNFFALQNSKKENIGME